MEHIKSENVDVIDKPGKTKRKRELAHPKKYKVILHNDDFTPMEFVVFILREFFHKTEEEANSITLQVHKLGQGIAGVYDYQLAEQRCMMLQNVLENMNTP